MEETSVVYNYPILIGSIILQNSKVHMFNYSYEIYPPLFGDYKVLYMDTDSIYAKLNISHKKYLKYWKKIMICSVNLLDRWNQNVLIILSKNLSVYRLNAILIFVKNNIENNKNKLKNNIIHSKGISNSYKNKYIDHTLF